MKTALITGITGQDGVYLTEMLLRKGYLVHGLCQTLARPDTAPLDKFFRNACTRNRLFLHHGDLTDGGTLWRLLSEIRPEEVYNLGAQSYVPHSFDAPEYTANVNALGTLRLLEAIRALDPDRRIRFYQASTSEMFGNAPAPQNEETPFRPCSPYATAKLYAYWTVANYRDAYGMFACNGILFNHESPLRGVNFVTARIASFAASYAEGACHTLWLGNLDAKRDWGHAADYVEGMWRMLNTARRPGDYVLASGEAYSVRACVEKAFSCIGRHLIWMGSGAGEFAIDTETREVCVRVDPARFRPAEVHHLCGDSSRARRELGWRPRHTLDSILEDMITAYRQNDRQESSWEEVAQYLEPPESIYYGT